jgi:hypothetical protein
LNGKSHIFYVNWNAPKFERGIHAWNIVELDGNYEFVQNWGPYGTRAEAFATARRFAADQCHPSKCGTCTYACDPLPAVRPDTEGVTER